MTANRQTIALLGDIMMTRSVAVYREPEYLKMREMLNACDAVFANFESCVQGKAGATSRPSRIF